MIEVWVKFNSNSINFFSLIISVFIVLFFARGIDKLMNHSVTNKTENKIENRFETKIDDNGKIEELNNKIEVTEEKNIDEIHWYIEIPKIDLKAPIEEGTDIETLNRAVGHFESTAKEVGNCCFAGHNRGYAVNYFAKLKELEKGDKINYFVNNQAYQYQVKEVVIIYETDWSMLEETEDNRITLITCVENRDEYRLCVQGIRVGE